MTKPSARRLAAIVALMIFVVPGANLSAQPGPPAPPQPGGGGPGGPGGIPMIPGFGPFGTRDPVADLMSALAEINLTPDFDSLSREQREKIQALRKDYDQRQAKWRTDHADEIRRVQNQMMAPFFRGPGAKPLSAEEAQALAKSREDLLASSPDGDAAAQQIEQTLTDPQRKLLSAWRADPAHQPANFGFGGPPPTQAPKGNALGADAIPKQPGFYRLKFEIKGDQIGRAGNHPLAMAYVLYLPKDYDPTKAPMPALIFLHGAGEAGSDGNAIFSIGPAMELQRQGPDSPLAKKFPFILICPQCPPRGERWDQPAMLKAVLALLDDLATKVHIDPDRLYITGLSMGGKGTWLLAMEAPQRFAAIAPIAADTLDARRAASLKPIATWAIVGEQDFGGAPDACRQMTAAITAAGGDAKLTIVPGEGHAVWPRYYADPGFYEWFLTHKRAATEAR